LVALLECGLGVKYPRLLSRVGLQVVARLHRCVTFWGCAGTHSITTSAEAICPASCRSATSSPLPLLPRSVSAKVPELEACANSFEHVCFVWF